MGIVRILTNPAVPALVDLRNVYKPAEVEAAGFAYRGVGKGRAS